MRQSNKQTFFGGYTLQSDQEIDHKLEQKKKRNRRLKLLGIVLVCFMIWVSTKWMDQQDILAQKEQELAQVQHQVDEAQQEQMELVYQVKRLHDKDYIAEIARRDYFLSRPGEVIFKIPEQND